MLGHPEEHQDNDHFFYSEETPFLLDPFSFLISLKCFDEFSVFLPPLHFSLAEVRLRVSPVYWVLSSMIMFHECDYLWRVQRAVSYWQPGYMIHGFYCGNLHQVLHIGCCYMFSNMERFYNSLKRFGYFLLPMFSQISMLKSSIVLWMIGIKLSVWYIFRVNFEGLFSSWW